MLRYLKTLLVLVICLAVSYAYGSFEVLPSMAAGDASFFSACITTIYHFAWNEKD